MNKEDKHIVNYLLLKFFAVIGIIAIAALIILIFSI
jgi:hypothetical protein